MKNMKKRGLSLALAAFMTVGACSSICAAAEEELDPVTIQLWLGGPGKQKDSDKVWEKFNEMLQEYVPNTTVEINVFTGEEYAEKFTQMLAAGEGVDLAWAADWVIGNFDAHMADGNFMELDELLDEYGQGIKETLTEKTIDIHRYPVDEKLYYLISWQGLFGGRSSFRVPTEFAELAGETWLEDTRTIVDKWWNEYSGIEDYEAMLNQFDIYFNALKENDKLYGGFNPDDLFSWYCDTPFGHGYPFINGLEIGVARGDDTYTVIDGYDTEMYRKYAETMADFYQKGYIRSDIASIEAGTLNFVKNNEFNANTIVMHCHSHLTDDTAARETATSGVDISTIEVQRLGYLSKGTATATVIPYCADEPERAMMVLDAIYTVPELYQLLIYGFEGEHYTDNGDGTITTPYGSQGTSEVDYGLWKWTIGTCENSLVTQADTAGYYDELKEKEETALVNDFMNFVFDDSKVSSIRSAIDAVDAEYRPMIMRGYTENWEETLDQWIAERKAAGIEDYIAEYQRQLDAYMDENGLGADAEVETEAETE